MMNQYNNRYGRSEGRTPACRDFSPYGRPVLREGMAPRSFSRPGGCGCGSGRTVGQARRSEGTSCGPVCGTPRTARERTSCGCEGSGSANGCELTRNRQGTPCGCEGSGMSVHCKRLMEQIRAVDFALYETVLYLDAYPHSCDALETYRKLRAQSEALRAEYEAACGPLTAFGNKGDTWDWMSKPFPWEYNAE